MRNPIRWIGLILMVMVMVSPPGKSAKAQEYTCRGCNQLTDKCETDPPGPIYAYCYQEPTYCHDYGDPELEGCIQMASVGADGIPEPETEPVDLPVSWKADGVVATVDCRGRIIHLEFSALRAQTLRAESAKIVI